MSLAKRRLLFYFFILLFIAIVPFVLLYATGRSINWQRLELEKTGGLIVDSDPAGALLTLNGKAPGTLARQFFGQAPDPHTKTKISGLRPGTYALRLELDGYAPWEEKITLSPGQVHNTETVRLFRLAEPKLISAVDAEAEASSLSPDGEILALLLKDAVTFSNLKNGQSATIKLPGTPADKTLSWSPDSRNLLIGSSFVVRLQNEAITNLSTVLPSAPLLARWAENSSLLALENETLWRLAIDKGSREKTADLKALLGGAGISDLESENGRLLLLLNSGANSQLLIFDIASPEREVRKALPLGSYAFARNGRNGLVVREQNRGTLYAVEHPLPLLSSYRLSPIVENYAVGNWNGDELVYATPFELRRWTKDAPSELITRWGEASVDIARIPKSDYLLFGTATTLNILPTSKRSFASALRLADIEKLSEFVKIEEHALYFIGRNKNQAGLFRLDF